MNFETKERLLDVLETARLLYLIYWAFANYRLITACDKSKFTASFQEQGRVGVSLKEFLTACHGTTLT